jgi:hypothetical protein
VTQPQPVPADDPDVLLFPETTADEIAGAHV